MDLLHATWRIAYVAAPKAPEQRAGESSPFARIAAAPASEDAEHLVVWRGPLTFVLLNRFPYNAGHLLVLPLREVADLSGLTRAEHLALAETVTFARDLAAAALRPDGFNVGLNLGAAAGAGIPRHLHWHVVPRWNGDTNFMPVVGATRVLPQALADTWSRFREVLPSVPPPPAT